MYKIIHNIETGEVQQVELTAEEISFQETMDLESVKQLEEVQSKAAAKAALLAKLGITEEEAKLLLS